MSQGMWDECGESKKMNSSLKPQERNGALPNPRF